MSQPCIPRWPTATILDFEIQLVSLDNLVPIAIRNFYAHRGHLHHGLKFKKHLTCLLFNRFEILPLNEHNFAIGSFMYKQINYMSPKTIDNITERSKVHNYNKRNTHPAHTMYTRNRKMASSISSIFNLGPKLWTLLTNTVKNMTTFDS